MWHEGSVRTNGIDIRYLRTGGDKPPVVLLHGLTDGGENWAELARGLEARYDLVMPDARGHGLSSAPERGYSTLDHAADHVGLIEALGLVRPALIGHSMGGLTATQIAAGAGTRLRALVLEDPPFILPDPAAGPRFELWPEQHARLKAMSLEDLVRKAKVDHERWSEETNELWARAQKRADGAIFEALGQRPMDFRALVARIAVPVLVVAGESAHGSLVSDAVAAELPGLNPRLRVVRVPGAGHCVRYDEGAKYLELVSDFLAEVFA
jgi:N-formylmaleamate deformylase